NADPLRTQGGPAEPCQFHLQRRRLRGGKNSGSQVLSDWQTKAQLHPGGITMSLPNPETPQVKDKRPSIIGLLPRNTQALVLGGLSVLMVLVMVFTGQKTPKPNTPPNPSATVIDPSQARIQEYRQKLEDQTHQLALEEAQLT